MGYSKCDLSVVYSSMKFDLAPLMNTFPSSISIWSPGTPITRFTILSGPSCCGSKTITSPRSGPANRNPRCPYSDISPKLMLASLLTNTRCSAMRVGTMLGPFTV